MKKVKLFSDSNPDYINKKLNAFIEENLIDVVDVKLSQSSRNDQRLSTVYSIILIYKENNNENL